MADFGFQTSQASGTSGIGGSGTTNYVSKFTAASTIGDSQIFDNATNVGIGTISPTSKLHILGIDSTSSNFALKVDNSASASLLSVRNDGNSGFGTASPNSVLQIKGTGVDLFDVTNNITNLVKVYSDEVTFFDRGLRINKLFQPFSASDITIYSASNAGVGFSLNIGSDFTGANTHYTNIIYTDNASTKRAFTITNTTVSSTGLLELMKDGGNVNIGSTFTNSARVHIQGIDATSSNYALKVENSTPTNLLSVRNDGVVDIYGTITPRLQSIVSSATVTPTNLNDEVVITAQATGLTLVNPTGTAVQGQSMIIRIKDNGTARTIAYDTQYRAIGVTLPTTTVINKIVYLGLIYNSTDTKWDVIGVSQEA